VRTEIENKAKKQIHRWEAGKRKRHKKGRGEWGPTNEEVRCHWRWKRGIIIFTEYRLLLGKRMGKKLNGINK